MDIVVPQEFKPLWEVTEEQPVLKYPAEALRRVAAPVDRVNKKTRELIERMGRVLTSANGIGLAAPQLGVSQRVILISPDACHWTALVNPEIKSSEGEIAGEEGCLSLPGLYGDVRRSAAVEVHALDEEGRRVKYRFEGLSARVAQHEIDHLDGILFIDKVDPATLYWAWPAHAQAVG